ncbi:MAG: GNAT family N-acetyltransferase [Oscillatoria sp. PMC 1068.18]|nr:GNAT family N-acetyltransferase [Oscillatoria sp. PMC 1076.18]MEC4990972.1 GNAT family N-acetyltransferase [Oscillatoria sp. PMC 1068.18]
MSEELLPGYRLRVGLGCDRALLVKFMQITYQEIFPAVNDFAHLADTVRRYFSPETPLWFVEANLKTKQPLTPVGCLWMGNGIDQILGSRYTHIFLLYVAPEHRRKGIGSALMNQAQIWAKKRGDRQIGLHVFQENQPALNLYTRLGYQTQSLLMVKPL